MASAVLDDLVGIDLLDELDALHRAQRETETRILRVATDFALEHGTETVDRARSLLPGRERAVRLGGQGTPKVAEFAPALVAGRSSSRRTPQEGWSPTGWTCASGCRSCSGGSTTARSAWAMLARRPRDAGADRGAGSVRRRRVAEFADGRISWSRFETLVEAAVIESDPEAAAERERRAATEQFARPTHSTDHGMRGFYIRAGLGVIAQFDAGVTFLADALEAVGVPGSDDERRVRAVQLMANPARAIAVIHAANDVRAGRETPQGVFRLLPDESTWCPSGVVRPPEPRRSRAGICRRRTSGGAASVSTDWVREHLGPRCRFRVSPVIDLAGQLPVDAYEIPDRHRRACI
jgi:hypothetical protein